MSYAQLKSQLPDIEKFLTKFDSLHNNELMAQLYGMLSDFYFDERNYRRALKFKQLSVQIFERLLSFDHPDLVVYYIDIATIFEKLGQKAAELDFTLKAYRINKKVSGENSPDVANSYLRIAMCYRKLGDYNESISFHKKYITSCEKLYGQESSITGLSYFELAITFYFDKDYNEAKKFIDAALELWQEAVPPEHIDLDNIMEIKEIIYRKAAVL